MRASIKAILVCGTAVGALAFSTSAFAQEEEVSTAAEGEILVTGSRIKQDGFDSPVPVTVVGAELIEDLGQTNAAEIIRLIPQNVASQSDATSGAGLLPEAGASFANLRGLNPTYGTRTLTLVNGRRFVPTSVGGQVDLNLIPSLMIGRIETVTGGASAAYGTDAVAGVVNIILDDQLEGFRGQVDYGQTGRGDGKSFHGAAAWGTNLGNRGHFILGGEYQRNRGIDHCAEARDWCGEGWTVVANASAIEPGEINDLTNVSGYNVPGSSGYGLPNYVIGRDGGLVYNSIYGTVRNYQRNGAGSSSSFSGNFPSFHPPLAAVDKVFTPDGTGIMDYDPGMFAPIFVGGLALGGDNDSAYADQYIQTPVERYTTYAAAEYELTDAINAYAELTYGKRIANSRTLTAATRSTMVIKPDNAFLPPELAALLNGEPFSLGKDVDEELSNLISVEAEAFRGLIGFEGGIFSDWTWDLYYQYGKNKRESEVRYSRHNDALAMAIDAIEDPNNPGNIICRPLDPALLATFSAEYRTELMDLHESCVPVNLFGQGNLTQAGVDFAWRPVGEVFDYRQHVVAGTVQGTLHDGWGAGPIGMAAGFEYRDEAGEITHGGLDASDYAFSFGLDYAGKIQVIEGFAETNVPVFEDWAIGDYFELNGAIRYSSNKATNTYTDEEKTVNATSWKVGGIYDMTDGVRFRATQSRDIRAAGFRELFRRTADTESGTAQGRVDNPNLPAANQTDAAALGSGGSFLLRPEIADTTTAGAVFTPAFIPRFQVSVDWYQIKLKDAISNLDAQAVVDYCFDFDILCDRITFDSPTDITRVDAGQSNVGRVAIRGVDFEASYRLPLADLLPAANGSLDFRFLLNYQYDFKVTPSPDSPAIQYAGQSGPITDGGDFYPKPKWTWNGLVAYNTDRFNATVNVRYIGSGILDVQRIGPEDPGYDPTLPNSISFNRVKSATYVNLAMSYEIPLGGDDDDYVEVFGTIDNLFDKDPPIAPGGGVSAGATAYPTNPVYFDTFGMRWRAGVRVKF